MKVTTAGQTVRAGRPGPAPAARREPHMRRRRPAPLGSPASKRVDQAPTTVRPQERPQRRLRWGRTGRCGRYGPCGQRPPWFIGRGRSEGQAPSVPFRSRSRELAAARRFARTMSGPRGARDSGKAGVSSVHRRYRAGRRVFSIRPVAYDLPTRGHSRDRCHDRLGPPAGEPVRTAGRTATAVRPPAPVIARGTDPPHPRLPASVTHPPASDPAHPTPGLATTPSPPHPPPIPARDPRLSAPAPRSPPRLSTAPPRPRRPVGVRQ
ncbi:hypothetical protein SALBM217S_01354 [Streptomyces griseoloalbus]